jgi:glycosyltransferase involved in cell wall biosynthesis
MAATARRRLCDPRRSCHQDFRRGESIRIVQENMKRRIAIVTEIIAPYRIPVFNALSAQSDVDLKVIFLSENDPVLRQWPIFKDEIRFPYEVLPSRRLRVGGLNLLLNRGLAASLKSFSPDAIICGGYNYPASWQAQRWAHRHEKRFVLWSESNQQDARTGNKPIENLKARFLRGCDGFVVPGKSAAAYLRSLSVDADRVFIAPNAVDNKFYSAHAETARSDQHTFRENFGLPQRYILFVGRFVPEKGVFDLLDAYAKLDSGLRAEVGLVFAGDGAAKEDLARRAEAMGSGAIRFTGFTQREVLAGLYAFADVMVLPTHSDTWGLVVNEAMACGLPVVLSDVAGCAADLVEDGWNGHVVPSRNVERLTVAIDSILRQPDRSRQMRLNSLKRIEKYSPEACADGLAASAAKEVQ